MGARVTERERLRHKVLISLNDDMYFHLLDEARRRRLAPSIVARQVFAKGLSEIHGKNEGMDWQNKEDRRGVPDVTTR